MNRRNFMTGSVITGVAVAAPALSQESASDNTFVGSLEISTDAKSIVITSEPTPHLSDRSFVHTINKDFQFGFRVQSYWTGTTENPYNNNDCGLFECWNTAAENSHNRSWAVSAANAYNHIPAGVTDSGDRVGVLGWAVSVNAKGHTHSGTLNEQVGVWGRAGFQAGGEFISPPSAKINKAVGVRGEINNDSPGATLGNAYAGEFVSVPGPGNILTNYAIYARAEGGQVENWSFYGASGRFYNGAKSFFGRILGQGDSAMASRMSGNSLEFGHEDTAGYGSNIGATYSNGFPFVAFCAEADTAGNTFTTRGKVGSVIYGDLGGGIVFGRVPKASGSGQAVVESVGINARGNLRLSRNPPSAPSAAGEKGEIAWDDNFVYVCVAKSTWKRSALSSW